MNLNDLLVRESIDPAKVLIMRHRPPELGVRKVLPWLAVERPQLYNAYQQTQPERVENQILRASHVASLVGHAAGKAIFAGLYAVGDAKVLTLEEYWALSEHIELKKYGMRGFTGDDGRASIRWFDLALTEFYVDWKGKLILGWPPPERSWSRWADRNELPVIAILEDSAFEAAMPHWQEIDLSWKELEILPARWKTVLAQWRGIYFIFDATDGKGYVGSASGSENLLGRWLNYAASGHGGNKLLRERDPLNFRFTILQRVSPDMPVDEVIALEGTWKERLHTRSPTGLNDN